MATRCESLDELASLLGHMLTDILDITEDGRILYGRKRVDSIGSIRIEIRSDEHAPPHFHVIGPDIDASFKISDGTILKGTITARDERIVRKWYAAAKVRLETIWNETRPSDCPVGRIAKQ